MTLQLLWSDVPRYKGERLFEFLPSFVKACHSSIAPWPWGSTGFVKRHEDEPSVSQF